MDYSLTEKSSRMDKMFSKRNCSTPNGSTMEKFKLLTMRKKTLDGIKRFDERKSSLQLQLDYKERSSKEISLKGLNFSKKVSSRIINRLKGHISPVSKNKISKE